MGEKDCTTFLKQLLNIKKGDYDVKGLVSKNETMLKHRTFVSFPRLFV